MKKVLLPLVLVATAISSTGYSQTSIANQDKARKAAASICQNLAMTNVIYALGGDGLNSNASYGSAKIVSETTDTYTIIATSHVSGLAAHHMQGDTQYQCQVEISKKTSEVKSIVAQ